MTTRILSAISAALLAAVLLPGLFGCAGGSEQTAGDTAAGAEQTAGGAGSLPETDILSEHGDTTMTDIQIKRGMGVTCDDLVQTGSRSQRWLSIPGSRLVINPFDFDANSPQDTHPQASDSAELPLNIGYLDPYLHNTRGRGLYSVAQLLSDTGNADAGIEVLWSANFESAKKWSRSGGDKTSVEVDGGVLTLTVLDGAPEPWQFASQVLRLDNVTADTAITITVDSCEGNWALKLNDGKSEDIKIQGDTNKTGTFTYYLSDFLPEGEKFRGVVKIFSIGYNKQLKVSGLKVSRLTARYTGAREYTVSWAPHALTCSASYDTGLALEYTDSFADEYTVTRIVNVTAGGRLAVGGMLYGSVTAAADGKYFTVNGERFSYGFASDKKPYSLSFYADSTALYTGQMISDPGSATAYLMDFGEVKAGDTLVFAFSLRSDASDAALPLENARSAASAGKAAEALSARKKYWNDYLEKIPAADEFTFEYVDAKGVTAEQLRLLYCIAWVFAAQNLLPENPELGYNFMQVCCGKPSMWGYGDPKSSYSASWESFFGMQMLAYTLPDKAWSAFMGLMSLVDDEGMLGGESLPSEKAHTAWVLYRLTGDKEKLAAVYDSISRYLDWRIENPRWIFLQHNDVNSADADFAESALVDIRYMIMIAGVVRPDDAAMWQKKYNRLLDDYKGWFFDANGNTYQYCDKRTFARSAGNTIWVTKGLYIPELTGSYESSLMARFNTEYRKNASFCGFYAVKYPDTSHTIYGLLARGKSDEAGALIEACARDVARVGMFSENYTNDDIPLPTGVRPSMFGCAMLIDSMLLKSGISYNFRLE